MTIKTISHPKSVAAMVITCMNAGRQSQTHECNGGIFYPLLRLPSFEDKTVYGENEIEF